jgi:hypothetical protein
MSVVPFKPNEHHAVALQLGGIKGRSAPPRPEEHALGTCHCLLCERTNMSPVDPRERRPDKPSLVAHMLPWLLAGLIVSVIVFAARGASAMDHGWDKSSPFAQWVESLMRPDSGYKYSCCGKGDLYEVEITQDALGETGYDMGTFVILEGGARSYPDGSLRPYIAPGTEFHFPKSKVNDRQGNPSKTAFAFLSGDYVWCVIPLPGAV